MVQARLEERRILHIVISSWLKQAIVEIKVTLGYQGKSLNIPS